MPSASEDRRRHNIQSDNIHVCIKSDRICRLAAVPFPPSPRRTRNPQIHFQLNTQAYKLLDCRLGLTSYHPRQGEIKKRKFNTSLSDLAPYHLNATHNYSTPPCQSVSSTVVSFLVLEDLLRRKESEILIGRSKPYSRLAISHIPLSHRTRA